MGWQLPNPKPLFGELKYGRRAINLANYHELSEQGKNEWKERTKVKGERSIEPSCWVPHPRTGIYYPEGSEGVMEGIPKGASSFGRSYWLRNTEGVDKPISEDISGEIFDHPFLNI